MTRYVGKCSPDSEPIWFLGPKAASWMLFRGIAISGIFDTDDLDFNGHPDPCNG